MSEQNITIATEILSHVKAVKAYLEKDENATNGSVLDGISSVIGALQQVKDGEITRIHFGLVEEMNGVMKTMNTSLRAWYGVSCYSDVVKHRRVLEEAIKSLTPAFRSIRESFG